MRKNVIAGLALAAALGFSVNSAGAGGIIDENTRDFTKFTCKDLLDDVADDIKKGKSPDEAAGMNMIMVAMWIDGYLSHETGDTQTTLSRYDQCRWQCLQQALEENRSRGRQGRPRSLMMPAGPGSGAAGTGSAVSA